MLDVRTAFAQWLSLAAVLLLLGSAIGLSLFAEHHSIDAGERRRLAIQAKVIDDNLGSQLHATNYFKMLLSSASYAPDMRSSLIHSEGIPRITTL